jgi:hypothetical protein
MRWPQECISCSLARDDRILGVGVAWLESHERFSDFLDTGSGDIAGIGGSGAGSRQGLLPGAPTDPDVPNSGIRLVRGWVGNAAVQPPTEAHRTPLPLSSRVTVTGSGASVCSPGFPPLGPSAGSALPSTGSSEASSPASAVLWRCATPWVPGTTRRCLRVALPGGVSVLSLPAVQNTKPRAGASSAGSPRRQHTPGDRQGLPSSWRILVCLCPALRPRQDRPTRPPFSGVGAAPVMSTTKAPTTHYLSGLHHTALALAVYASSGTLLYATQDSLPAAGPLYGTGLVTRRILPKGFRPMSSSSPRLAWRKDALNCFVKQL